MDTLKEGTMKSPTMDDMAKEEVIVEPVVEPVLPPTPPPVVEPEAPEAKVKPVVEPVIEIEVEDKGIDVSSLTDILINNKEEVAMVMNNIGVVTDYIKKVKKPSLMRYFDDKIFVIIGVVGIAIAALFLIPDPAGILMSIVSGLFGMASGRALSKDDE